MLVLERGPQPGDIPALGAFYLDDVRPEIGQQGGAVGPGQGPTQVQDGDAGQGCGGAHRRALPVAISDASAIGLIRVAPHMLLFPSIFLSLTVLAFILMGDALRDALDPKLRR